MKRIIGVSLAVWLGLNFALIPTNATQAKANGNCSKSGLVTTIKGSKYICSKVGTKLLWTKKVLQTPGKVTPTPTKPNQAPSPTATPSKTPAAIKIRANGPQTATGQIAAEVIYKILNQVSAELYERSKFVTKSQSVVISDEPGNTLISPTLRVTHRTTEMMRAIMSDYPDNQVFLFRSDSWFESKMNPLCPNIVTNQIQFGWANAGCGKFWAGSLSKYENPGFTYDKNWSAEKLLTLTGSHESVHLIQVLDDREGQDKIPAWYREGSANVGAGLVITTFPEYGNGDYGYSDDISRNSWAKPRCEAVFKKWREINDPKGHEYMKNCEYDLGRKVIEYLVARDKNFDNIYKVNQAVKSGMGFDDAFLKVHGISRVELLDEVEAWLEKLDWAKAVSY